MTSWRPAFPPTPAWRGLVGLVLLLQALPLRALPEDREQPIEIQADRAELDERQGIAVYSGAVELQQGTLRVTAARMTIWIEDDEVSRILAEGDEASGQAHYQQLPEPGASLLLADADTITYLVGDQRVRLDGDATIVQAGDRFAGPTLRYDITGRIVEAEGGADARIRMTLQPERMSPAP